MRSFVLVLLGVLYAFSAVGAAEIPRSARLMKDGGNQFLAAKKYADAIDSYFQALDIYPDFAEAHYNLGVAFLKGYKQLGLARHHFQRYLELSPGAPDAESVRALVSSLGDRVQPTPSARGQVLGVVGGRLLVSGSEWVKSGTRIDVAERGKQPCASLTADYVYPDCVLTQRVWDEKTLDALKPGLVAVSVP